MNTNEDNYFNYTVLSFTYILFSKLLMHIYIQGAAVKSGQISIWISHHIVVPSEVAIEVVERHGRLVNSHNLKIAEMIRTSAEYNRRAAIIESLRAGRSATEIIRFFGYPRSTVYDVVAKYNASEKSEEGSANPFSPKLAIRQCGHVLVQRVLAPK